MTAVNPVHFFPALEQGATLLTVNQRLARYLRQAFNANQQALGHSVWISPDILPLSTWLERSWNEILDSIPANNGVPELLTHHQQRTLWERIITESAQGQHLLQVSSAADTASAAWTLLKQWRITLESVSGIFGSASNTDNHAFMQWAQRFEKLCRKNAWLDSATLPDAVIQQIKAGVLPVPSNIGFAGFDEFTPQQQHLLQSLSAKGVNVTRIAPPESYNEGRVRCGCADVSSEIIAAAQWARQILDTDADATIAVVVPDLGALRETVARSFDQVFSPTKNFPNSDRVAAQAIAPYNISLGTALLDEPIIYAALLMLEFAGGKLALEKMGNLLRSPFLAGAEQEMTRRALLDARLRRAGELMVTLESLRYHAASASDSSHACPEFAARLIKWADLTRIFSSTSKIQQVPSKWVTAFTRLLACMAWPGERSLNSREYQAEVAWRGLLADYALLDRVVGKQTSGEAVGDLRTMAAATLFQPQGSGAPIQIMGLLETAGLQFDHMWIMGLHDNAWPEAMRPNPFLPLTLQRQHNMPHASALRELAFAQQITQRLFSSARNIVASYPQQEDDRALHPSPLICFLPEVSLQELIMESSPFYVQIIHASARLEILNDHVGPVLEAGSIVTGGTDVLKQQAACPFRAFARHRLGAQPLNRVSTGLNASERGKLLHAVMENVWQTVQSHETLCHIPSEDLQRIISDAVARALSKMARNRPMTFSEKFTALEQARLEKLVTEWMALEKQRHPFTVFQTEQERIIEIGDIAFTARIDRIDELPSRHHVIVDYKTGNANPQSWFGDRPDEPQLPLYGVSSAHEVAALVFAQLRTGELCFKGLSNISDIIPNVKEFENTKNIPVVTWQNQLHEWRQTLHHLATGFRMGDAAVDPKKPGETCKYCEFTALCRIHEHDGWGLASAPQEENDD